MRILAVSNWYPPHFRGGFEISASLLCLGLRDAGHEVHVLSQEQPAAESDRQERYLVERILQVPHHPGRYANGSERMQGWHSVSTEFANGAINEAIVSKHVSNHSYDIALLFNLQGIGTSLVYAIEKQNIPVVWSVADYWHIERKAVGLSSRLGRLHRSLYRRRQVRRELSVPLARAIFISRFLQERYREAGIVPAESHVVHRGCPDVAPVVPFDSAHRTSEFIIASQIERHKGLHIVLEAMGILQSEGFREDWSVAALGDGEPGYEQELQDRAAQLGLASRFRMEGKLPHADVLRRIQTSWGLIHPAIWEEPFGRVAIEAFACGTPLVTADTGAIGEIVDSSNALMYPKLQADALARHLAKLIHNEALGKALSEAGRQAHQLRFRTQSEIDSVQTILSNIAGMGASVRFL